MSTINELLSNIITCCNGAEWKTVNCVDKIKEYAVQALNITVDSPQWVNAEDQLPETYGRYHAERNGEPFVLFFIEQDKQKPKAYWNGVLWLNKNRENINNKRFAHDISEAIELAKFRMKALVNADEKEVDFILEKVFEALNKWSIK